MSPSRRVVVTGLGGLTPLSRAGQLIKDDWKRLVQGSTGIRNILQEREEPTSKEEDDEDVWNSLPSRIAARIPNEAFEGSSSSLFSATEHKMMSRGKKVIFCMLLSGIFSSPHLYFISIGMKLAVLASDSALADAGLFTASSKSKSESTALIPNPFRAGVSVGMAMVDMDYIAQCHALIKSGQIKKLSPYFVPRILPNLAPGNF